MLSWESEDHLVEEYEGLIKANTEPSVPMHFGDVVIAIALRESVPIYPGWNPARASGAEGWRHIRDHLRKTLRVLDALHTIATEELKQNKKFVIPGVAQLKVKGQRPKNAAKPKGSKATTVKAFPSSAFKKAVPLSWTDGGAMMHIHVEEIDPSIDELIHRDGGAMLNTDS